MTTSVTDLILLPICCHQKEKTSKGSSTDQNSCMKPLGLEDEFDLMLSRSEPESSHAEISRFRVRLFPIYEYCPTFIIRNTDHCQFILRSGDRNISRQVSMFLRDIRELILFLHFFIDRLQIAVRNEYNFPNLLDYSRIFSWSASLSLRQLSV